ncbi:MAG: putative glycoside hydrolase [Marmoricola sp.]|nr:putative glycoside hydrolase [Marmoricola sp.]
MPLTLRAARTPTPRPRLRALTTLASVSLLAVLVSLVPLAATSGSAAFAESATAPSDGLARAAASAEPFLAGERYRGSFPDPTVMRLGSTYYASGTTVANLNLPLMTSTDLRTWRPRPALAHYDRYSSWKRYNDAMPHKPAWAATRGVRQKVKLMSMWAPSLAKVGDHYLAAYSAAVRLSPRHSCIGIASSASPLGLYRDPSSTPLVCYRPAALGAIDPDIFVDPRTGKAYLLWKDEGVHNTHPPRLVIRQLDATGTRFAAGSAKRLLVTRDQAWEGSVVENPSMVYHGGRYYLLYSGNSWRTARYGVGYAICKSPAGPCSKPTRTPLLASGGAISGPGGADALVDEGGRLRMVYAAWNAGRVGPTGTNIRPMFTASLAADRSGKLRVTSRG